MKRYILPIVALSTLAACQAVPINKDPQYWERESVSETVYLRGQKAQQMLNRDIARCVTELRELERLGQLKNAIPPDTYDSIDSLDELERLDWDSPERDDNLLAEHMNYQNFRDCMRNKGWKRTKNVSYEKALRAQSTYDRNHAKNNYDEMLSSEYTGNTAGNLNE